MARKTHKSNVPNQVSMTTVLPCLLEAEEATWRRGEVGNSFYEMSMESSVSVASEDPLGSAVLRHGNTVKHIHSYFSNFEARKCCLNLAGGPTRFTNVRLVRADTRDSDLEGAIGRPIHRTQDVDRLNEKELSVYRQALMCAQFPVLGAPRPPQDDLHSGNPTPTYPSQAYPTFSYNIPIRADIESLNTISSLDSFLSMDNEEMQTSVIPPETLCERLRQSFGLSRERAAQYEKIVYEPYRRRKTRKDSQLDQILAEELSEQLHLLENGSHPFYNRKAYLSRVAFVQWQKSQRQILFNLIHKFWPDSQALPRARSPSHHDVGSYHDNYKFLMERVMSYEMASRRSIGIGSSTLGYLSSASQRLLKEFSLRYGIGDLYRSVVYIDFLTSHFECDAGFIDHLTSQLCSLLEAFPSNKQQLIMVTEEWNILYKSCAQLHSQCERVLSQVNELLPSLGVAGLGGLIKLLKTVLDMKIFLHKPQRQLDVYLREYTQASFESWYVKERELACTELRLDLRFRPASPQLINKMLSKAQVEVTEYRNSYQAVFDGYLDVSGDAARAFYSLLMADIAALCSSNTNQGQAEDIRLDMLALTFRLHQLDLDWASHVPAQEQSWRRLFLTQSRDWLGVLGRHLASLVLQTMAADVFSTLTLPKSAGPEDFDPRTPSTVSVQSLTPSRHSAFSSFRATPIQRVQPKLQRTSDPLVDQTASTAGHMTKTRRSLENAGNVNCGIHVNTSATALSNPAKPHQKRFTQTLPGSAFTLSTSAIHASSTATQSTGKTDLDIDSQTTSSRRITSASSPTQKLTSQNDADTQCDQSTCDQSTLSCDQICHRHGDCTVDSGHSDQEGIRPCDMKPDKVTGAGVDISASDVSDPHEFLHDSGCVSQGESEIQSKQNRAPSGGHNFHSLSLCPETKGRKQLQNLPNNIERCHLQQNEDFVEQTSTEVDNSEISGAILKDNDVHVDEQRRCDSINNVSDEQNVCNKLGQDNTLHLEKTIKKIEGEFEEEVGEGNGEHDKMEHSSCRSLEAVTIEPNQQGVNEKTGVPENYDKIDVCEVERDEAKAAPSQVSADEEDAEIVNLNKETVQEVLKERDKMQQMKQFRVVKEEQDERNEDAKEDGDEDIKDTKKFDDVKEEQDEENEDVKKEEDGEIDDTDGDTEEDEYTCAHFPNLTTVTQSWENLAVPEYTKQVLERENSVESGQAFHGDLNSEVSPAEEDLGPRTLVEIEVRKTQYSTAGQSQTVQENIGTYQADQRWSQSNTLRNEIDETHSNFRTFGSRSVSSVRQASSPVVPDPLSGDVLVSGSVIDVTCLLVRLVQFVQTLCQTLCPFPDAQSKVIPRSPQAADQTGPGCGPLPSQEDAVDKQRRECVESREQLYSGLLQILSSTLCLYANNILCMDLCGLWTGEARKLIGKQLLDEVNFEHAQKRIWGCRHMTPGSHDCDHYSRQRQRAAKFLADCFEPITQQMCTRLNNLHSLCELLPHFENEAGMVVQLALMKDIAEELELHADEQTANDFTVVEMFPTLPASATRGLSRASASSYSSCHSDRSQVHEVNGVILGHCKFHLERVKDGLVHIMAHRMNLFFREGLALLLGFSVPMITVEKQMAPLVEFLERHLNALQGWLYSSCFKSVASKLWELIAKDFEDKTQSLQNYTGSTAAIATNMIQSLAMFIRFFNQHVPSLSLDCLTSKVSRVSYWLQLYTQSTQHLIALHRHLEAAAAYSETSSVVEHLPSRGFLQRAWEELHAERKCFSGQQFISWLLQNPEGWVPGLGDLDLVGLDEDVFPDLAAAQHLAQKLMDSGIVSAVDHDWMSSTVPTRPSSVPSGDAYPKLTEVHTWPGSMVTLGRDATPLSYWSMTSSGQMSRDMRTHYGLTGSFEGDDDIFEEDEIDLGTSQDNGMNRDGEVYLGPESSSVASWDGSYMYAPNNLNASRASSISARSLTAKQVFNSEVTLEQTDFPPQDGASNVPGAVSRPRWLEPDQDRLSMLSSDTQTTDFDVFQNTDRHFYCFSSIVDPVSTEEANGEFRSPKVDGTTGLNITSSLLETAHHWDVGPDMILAILNTRRKKDKIASRYLRQIPSQLLQDLSGIIEPHTVTTGCFGFL